MTDFETARFNMVESQIRTNDITDPALLKAFQTVPREAFVPASVEAIAYMDEDLCVQPAAEGRAARYLMEPRVFAKLVQAAEITDSDLVLDVGCATGYSAAILARVADAVVAVEADEELAAKAGETLLAQSVDNAAVVVGKLQDGCAKQGPFDVIVLSGSV